MAKKNDSGGSGGTAAAALREALGLMHGSAAQLYDIANGLDGEEQEAIEVIAAELDGKQCGQRFEHLAKLTVPRDYIEAFRQGLLRELKFVGEWLGEQALEAKKSLAAAEHPDWFPPHERPKGDFDPFECINGPLNSCQATAQFLRDLDGEHSCDVVLAGDHQMLMHAAQAAGHERAEKHLADAEFGGPEAVKAAEIVAWAAAEAERLEVEREAQSEQDEVVGGKTSDEKPAARALLEVDELARGLRKDLELAISTVDVLVAEAAEAGAALTEEGATA